jgi:hypothetical protein
MSEIVIQEQKNGMEQEDNKDYQGKIVLENIITESL